MFENSLLIGFSGFVGETLARQIHFRTQISGRGADSTNEEFDFAICAAAPGVKWLANKEPETDLEAIQALEKKLLSLRVKHFVLVSTVDVYANSVGATELTTEGYSADAYGKHRQQLEQFVTENFDRVTVARLPGLVGDGLRKNLLFDTHEGRPVTVNPESRMQFYPTERLAGDLHVATSKNLELVNFAVAPVRLADVLADYDTVTYSNEAPIITYNMQTIHALEFGVSGNYIVSAESSSSSVANYLAGRL